MVVTRTDDNGDIFETKAGWSKGARSWGDWLRRSLRQRGVAPTEHRSHTSMDGATEGEGWKSRWNRVFGRIGQSVEVGSCLSAFSTAPARRSPLPPPGGATHGQRGMQQDHQPKETRSAQRARGLAAWLRVSRRESEGVTGIGDSGRGMEEMGIRGWWGRRLVLALGARQGLCATAGLDSLPKQISVSATSPLHFCPSHGQQPLPNWRPA